jgi:hypothetical protein
VEDNSLRVRKGIAAAKACLGCRYTARVEPAATGIVRDAALARLADDTYGGSAQEVLA